MIKKKIDEGSIMKKIKVVHIINSLNYGGAEVMLCSLLARTDRERFESMVVALIDVLPLAERVEALGIPVRVIGMRPGVPDPRGVVRLARLLHRERPGVIQTWMYHSNLIGGIAARLSVPAPVVWGIHHSSTEHDARAEKRTTLWTVAVGARLSRRLPARIVCCSESARRQHEQRGYATEKLMVIPNGFDTGAFRPDPTARFEVRRELGIGPDTLLVGLVARYSTQKDPLNFLRAVAILKDRCPGVHFVLCGTQMDEANAELVSVVEAYGLRGRCHLLGTRRDMPRLTASLDLAVQSSITEAFPLALGEALACGVPCVATDVGDSAAIIGESGRIVPPRDPQALAAACRELLELSPEARARMGQSGRLRIQERYELVSITRRYENLYETLLRAAHASGRPSSAGCRPRAGRRGKVNRSSDPSRACDRRRTPRWTIRLAIVLPRTSPSMSPLAARRDSQAGRCTREPSPCAATARRSAPWTAACTSRADGRRGLRGWPGATSSTCPRGSSSGAATST